MGEILGDTVAEKTEAAERGCWEEARLACAGGADEIVTVDSSAQSGAGGGGESARDVIVDSSTRPGSGEECLGASSGR